jgi:hypothetical protein
VTTSTHRQTPPQSDSASGSYPVFIDPVLIHSARSLYLEYCRAHADRAKRPLGIAMNPNTYRGHLVFAAKPILLPMESFLPIEYLDSDA